MESEGRDLCCLLWKAEAAEKGRECDWGEDTGREEKEGTSNQCHGTLCFRPWFESRVRSRTPRSTRRFETFLLAMANPRVFISDFFPFPLSETQERRGGAPRSGSDWWIWIWICSTCNLDFWNEGVCFVSYGFCSQMQTGCSGAEKWKSMLFFQFGNLLGKQRNERQRHENS